jgi:hypothetical protein
MRGRTESVDAKLVLDRRPSDRRLGSWAASHRLAPDLPLAQ